MKIFVVGGAGYIGSVCSELLLNEGHDVVIFDNLSEGHRDAVDSRTHFIEGELADRQQIEADRPDAGGISLPTRWLVSRCKIPPNILGTTSATD